MLRGLTWVAFGATFAPLFYVAYGIDGATLYLAAYGFELLLSVENPQIVATMLRFWRIPTADQPRLQRAWFAAAVVSRVLLLVLAWFVLRRFEDAIYLIGAYGAYQGARLWWEDAPREPRPPARAGYLRVLATLEARLAIDSLLLLAVTRCFPILIAASVIATIALRRTPPMVTAWLSTLTHLQTTAAGLLLAAGAKLMLAPHVALPPALLLGIVGGGIYNGYRASRRPS